MGLDESMATGNDLVLQAIYGRIGDTNENVKDLSRKVETMRENSISRDTWALFTQNITNQFTSVTESFQAVGRRFDTIESEIDQLKSDDAAQQLTAQKGKLPDVVVDVLKYGVAGVVTTIIIYIIHGGKW